VALGPGSHKIAQLCGKAGQAATSTNWHQFRGGEASWSDQLSGQECQTPLAGVGQILKGSDDQLTAELETFVFASPAVFKDGGLSYRSCTNFSPQRDKSD